MLAQRSILSLTSMPTRSRDTRRSGATLVLVVVLLLLLIGFLGLSLDVAHLRTSAQELQAAADAAALAAAQLVTDDEPDTDYAATRQEALDVALENMVDGSGVVLDANSGNAAGGDVVVGRWDRFTQTFTPTTEDPDAVQVRARRTDGSGGGSIGLTFGPIFGAAASDVSRTATAHFGGDWGPAVLVLHPTLEGAMDVRGTASLQVPRDGIQVNSGHARAFKMNGAPDVPRVRARRIGVHGNYRVPAGSCYPVPKAGADVIPDPLADLAYPDRASMPNRGSIRAAGSYQPGYYPGGVDFNSGTASLAPGVYVFGPPGINVHADAVLEGEEVMLFIDIGGRITIAGNAPGIDLSGPSSGTYQGIAVFQHRSNSLACDISGGGVFDIRGTMYLAGAHLEMDGNVERKVGRMIINTLLLRGTAEYLITGIGHPPRGPKASFLVH